jgi:hypothetical protein
LIEAIASFTSALGGSIMADITRIPNVELQEAIKIKDWIGWKVGWMTGWYNPIDRLGEVIDPVAVGRLVVLQGELMQKQGQIAQEFGAKLSDLTKEVMK